MELPNSLRWIEVDYPHVIELKEDRLASDEPRCKLDRVKLDLTDRLARRFFAETASGATKVLVRTEGVIPYLTDTDVSDLAEDLRKTEKVRLWITDYFSPEAIRYGQKMRARFMCNAPFQFVPQDWFGFFQRHGWRAKEIRYIADEADRLGRPIPISLPLRVWVMLAGAFVSAAKRARMRQYAAYVLLLPA